MTNDNSTQAIRLDAYVALVRTVLREIPRRDAVYGDRDWDAVAADADALDAAIDALLAATEYHVVCDRDH